MHPNLIYQDFQTFQLKLLLSLRQDAPFSVTLQSVIAASLAKFQAYFGSQVVIHVLPNLEKNKADAMIVGISPDTQQSLMDEQKYRHGSKGITEADHQKLPEYITICFSEKENEINKELKSAFDPAKDIRIETIDQLAFFLKKLSECCPSEFSPLPLKFKGEILIVPLFTQVFQHLGYIISWDLGQNPSCSTNNSQRFNELFFYRETLRRFLIKVLTNFYHIDSQTYLPSYSRSTRRSVSLLCIEIRDFEHICRVLRTRRDFDNKSEATCLRRLINCFSESMAKIIEKNDGRVNQFWGDGLVAVFSGHPDTPPNCRQKPACIRAIIAAAELEKKFRVVAWEWLKNDFGISRFKEQEKENISLSVKISINYGPVFFDFDYLGKSKHRFHLAVGDEVNFVKQLASVPVPSLERPPSLSHFPPKAIHEHIPVSPIFLSQSAFAGAVDSIDDIDGIEKGKIKKPRNIYFPESRAELPVYEIWPENIITVANS